jgi:hypothetical protein
MRARHLELEVRVAGDDHELRVAPSPKDGMVGSVKYDHLEGEGLRPIVGWIPECYGQDDLPKRYCLHPGTMPWNGAPESRMRNQSMPMASRVSAYMMLRSLPRPSVPW